MKEKTMPKEMHKALGKVSKNIVVIALAMTILISPVIGATGVVSGQNCLNGYDKFLTGTTGILESDIVCDDSVTYEGQSIKIPPLDDGGSSLGDNYAGVTVNPDKPSDVYEFNTTVYYSGSSNLILGAVFNKESDSTFEYAGVRSDNGAVIYDVDGGSGSLGDTRDAFGGVPDNTWINYYFKVDNNANDVRMLVTEASNGNVIWDFTMDIDGSNPTSEYGPAVGAIGTDGSTVYIDSSVTVPSSSLSGTVTDTNGNPIENATVETNTSVSTTTDENGDYTLDLVDGTYTVNASKSNYKTNTKTLDVTGGSVTQDFVLEKIKSNLSIEGTNFVRPNQTIGYTIQYENESGTYTVNDYATISSENTSKLTIDTNNLTMTGGQYNATVDVTAKYNTTAVNSTVTRTYYISYLRLQNIDTVPPPKWIQAFLGYDDDYGQEGITGLGSEIQWILFLILLMSTIAKTFENAYAGVGSGVISSVLLWVLEYITLGLMFSFVFFGIFIGLLVVKTRSRGTNINVNNE